MLTLKDKLSHLNYRKACKLLGGEGEKLIMKGGKFDIDIDGQVEFTNGTFNLNLPDALVTISHTPEADQYLRFRCSSCETVCIHVGAAFSLVLEEKLALGLAAPPPEKTPVESLSEEEAIQQAIDERTQRAQKEKMKVNSLNPKELWTDYTITNNSSGKTYRVALRGWERGESYCSCPDYKRNTLGTCKHIIFALEKLKSRFSEKKKNTPYVRRQISVSVRHGQEMELAVLVPDDLDSKALSIIKPVTNRKINDLHDLLQRIKKVEDLGHDIIVYPDAEELINRRLYLAHVKSTVAEIRKDPKNHPLRENLLKTELLPYQLDGIAFAVGVGRAILADDMGLGKTIQGIGVAALLSREYGIAKVLVICPASLKSQWRLEIERFSDFSCQIVLGTAEERAEQYDNSKFFTLFNYEQVLRDINTIERVSWDLIILDEGQRIKNWEAKTSRIVKSLKSPFALVLSGTPLENRLDDLYSVVEFIDDQRLGPAFHFFNTYRVADDRGRPLGYKNLDQLRERLQPILLRRTRQLVVKDLPSRTNEIRRIIPTDEQLDVHNAHKKLISVILNKPYISEMDLLRLQKALLMCRLAANSTYLVDKQEPGFSSKLDEIDDLLEQLFAEEDRKIVLFSEWTRMLNMIEPLLAKRKVRFVRLDGSVPQKKRQGLMNEFQNDPDCKLFITTNAGATGLNLQAANTVINVDLPWNPAVLEQRIARAHRMGQKRPVQVFLLVTENTLEESLLNTLAAKQELALAALDPDSDVAEVSLTSGIEELKRRLEVLLGNKPDAPLDVSEKLKAEQTAEEHARKERIADAGGQLLGAAFAFIGEMLPRSEDSEKAAEMTGLFKEKLAGCMEKDENGKLKMTISLPDDSALDNIAQSLAAMVISRN
jgi:SNF2 family DNA or RNA helicase